MFAVWIGLGAIVWLISPHLAGIVRWPFPGWVRVAGVVVTGAGVILGAWAEWLIGVRTAILTARIFDAGEEQQTRVVASGPYAWLPHPMFVGEWLMIAGCLLLTCDACLLALLLVAVPTDAFAARREEADSRARFGQEYADYRSRVALGARRTQATQRV